MVAQTSVESALAPRNDRATSGHVRIPSAGLGALHRYGEGMSEVPTSVGVFFGQVDKRPKGWYWADTKNERLKGAIRGPFETKKQAAEDALHSIASDEPEERGAA
jgi:hypothetical protein